MRAARGFSSIGRQWEAVTTYRRIWKAPGVSLLEVEMRTGVTHQIRAHLAACGHPIVGDSLYGERHQMAFGLRRHFLHACSVTIVHPDTGQPLTVVADLPQDLLEVLRRLRIS